MFWYFHIGIIGDENIAGNIYGHGSSHITVHLFVNFPTDQVCPAQVLKVQFTQPFILDHFTEGFFGSHRRRRVGLDTVVSALVNHRIERQRAAEADRRDDSPFAHGRAHKPKVLSTPWGGIGILAAGFNTSTL